MRRLELHIAKVPRLFILFVHATFGATHRKSD